MSEASSKNIIWECKIGGPHETDLDDGPDFPMRRAVEAAYHELTGKYPHFIFSGWGGSLSKSEQEVADEISGSKVS